MTKKDKEWLESLSKEKLILVIKYLSNALKYKEHQCNYYYLYSELLSKNITDEEFDNEIDNNLNRYLVSNDNKPDHDELYFITEMAETDLFVEDTKEDYYNVFGLDDDHLHGLMKEIS